MIYTDTIKKIHTDLLYGNLTYQIRKASFNIYNVLGFGHKEPVYQKALHKEMQELKIPFKREAQLPVMYKGDVVGSYRPDFIVDDKIIIELKSVEFMPKSFETQIIYYLKMTNYQLGLLINFGAPHIQIRRMIWTP